MTAHPTQAVRRTLLSKYTRYVILGIILDSTTIRIAELLEIRDRSLLTPAEAHQVQAALKREIVAIWRTNSVRRIKPTPEDEARAGLIVIEKNLWDIVPKHFRTADHALSNLGVDPLPLDTSLITFGSWIGGDRDGNPFVTAALTREILKLSRWRAAELYYKEVDRLLFELSVTQCTPAFAKMVDDLYKNDAFHASKAVHYDFSHDNIPKDEYYRRYLAGLRERLKITYTYMEVSQAVNG